MAVDNAKESLTWSRVLKILAVIGGIAALVTITLGLPAVYNMIRANKLLAVLLSEISRLWHIASVDVPFYIVIIAFTLGVLLRPVWRLLRGRADSKDGSPGTYARARIAGVDWEWLWGRDSAAYKLTPLCPKCKNELVYSLGSMPGTRVLRCSNCGFSKPIMGDSKHFEEEIKREIRRRDRVEEWRANNWYN